MQDLKLINMLTSPERILRMISTAREKKGKEEESLRIIEKAINTAHDYMVSLYFERAHIYQLLYMTERDKSEKGNKGKQGEALKKMEQYAIETEKYIKIYNLDRWFHRLYRFYGKLNEYKKNYSKAVEYYKKSLKYAMTDPEVVEKNIPRQMELEGFLASALIMSGRPVEGLRLTKSVYSRYNN